MIPPRLTSSISRAAILGTIGIAMLGGTSAALVAAPSAGGSMIMPPGKPPEQRNAALVYWNAWTMADQDAMKADIDWNAIGENLDPAKMPEVFTKTAAGMSNYSGAMGDILRATAMPICDFELAYENGFELLMPHLAKLRSGARLLRVEARSLLMEGKAAEAAERVAGMLRMSLQLKDDGVLISSLVGMAIASAGLDEAQTLVGSGKLSRADAAPLIDAMARLSGRDSLRVRGCIAGEGRILKDWLARRFTGPTAGADFINGFGAAIAPTKDGAELDATKAAIAKMNAQQLSAEVGRTLEAYALIDQLWDTPEPAAELDKLGARVAGGEFGPLAVVISPSFGKSRISVAKFEERLAEFGKSLAALK